MSYNFNKTMRELNSLSKILKEAYVFDEADNEMPREGMQGEEDGEMYDNEEMESEMQDGHTNDIIDKIRMLALDGIQKYSEDVDNEWYITFKKIWMMCDKCLSEQDKVEN